MRKPPTDIRPIFINQADISIQKCAACARACQDDTFVHCIGGVLFQELPALQAHGRREPLNISLRKLDGSNATAVRARGAINLVFHAFGDAAQNAVGMVTAFQMTPKTFILRSLLFTEYLNLNQIGDHKDKVIIAPWLKSTGVGESHQDFDSLTSTKKTGYELVLKVHQCAS